MDSVGKCIKDEFLRCPITSLAFIGEDYLVCGYGPYINVYNWRNGSLLNSIQLFARNKIFGFSVLRDGNNHRIAAWGGRSFAIFQFVDLISENGEFSCRERFLHDWIMKVSLSEDDMALVLTAHNELVTIGLESSLHIISHVSCKGETSILYSGTISDDHNLIASGTVLGSVVVWNNKGEILYRFDDHEGSIFGVSFSPDGRYVVSCSDDRSIRLWSLENGACIGCAWGHTARIWQMVFVQGLDDMLSFVSCSEDATARLWVLDNEKLECKRIFRGHSGKHVWSIAIDSGSGCLATGGGDGRLHLWDIENLGDNGKVWDIGSAIASTRLSYKVSKGETFKTYAILFDRSIIVNTVSGHVLHYNPFTYLWKDILYDSDLSDYSLAEAWPSDHLAALGDRFGNITVINPFKDDRVFKIRTGHKDKFRLFAIGGENNSRSLICQPINYEADIKYYEVIEGIEGPKVSKSLDIPGVEDFTVKCAQLVDHHLFLGSRYGALTVYNVAKRGTLVTCRRSLINNDALTSICPLPQENEGISTSQDLLLTCRDGSWGIIRLCLSEGSISIIHVSNLQFGTIEGSCIVQKDIILYGFHTNAFFVWNETRQYEVMRKLCGGSHRNWRFKIDQTSEDKFIFAFTKASKLSVVLGPGQEKFNDRILLDGTHGREIRVVTVSPMSTRKRIFFATAAEDTCIRLCTLDESFIPRTCAVLRKHVSGIQQLRWSDDGAYLFSTAAREELFIWEISYSDSSMYAHLILQAPLASTEMPDLRVMDVSLTPLKAGDSKHGNWLVSAAYSDSTIRVWIVNAEKKSFIPVKYGRYKECCILNVETLLYKDRVLLVITATDGRLAISDITQSVGTFGISISENCQELKEENISSRKESTPQLDDKHMDWLSSLQIHQSGIKALKILNNYESDADCIFILTGGDDNAITLSSLMLNEEGKFKVTIMSKETSAHSSTITCFSVIEGKNNSHDEWLVASTSVDQQVKLWKINSKESSIALSHNVYTTVADTGTCDVANISFGDIQKKKLLLIAGAGISGLSL